MKKDLPSVTLIGVESREKYLPLLKTAADICQKYFNFGAVKLLTNISDPDPRTIEIKPINSTIEFSEFCIKEMWKYVETEYALVFQFDGFILNPEAWTPKFLEYDYIGSPWYHLNHISVGKVGNGGFSLRSKKLLDFIGKNYEVIGGDIHPEDDWICNVARPFLEKMGIKFAPVSTASQFSMEGTEKFAVWDGQFGFHGLHYTDISKWLDKNPEYKNKIVNKFDDFTKQIKKYPVYDGTVHVLRSKKIQIDHYKKLSTGNKNYDCRLDIDLSMLDEIKENHIIIYRRTHRIPFEKLPIPAFERIVSKVEKFSSKKDLLSAYPNIKITNSFNIPKWKQKLVEIFGNIIFPNNSSYTLFWFK